jgi:hypothetical protein
MIPRTLYLLAAVAALATAPAMAQAPAATAPLTAQPAPQAGGPRLDPGYSSYQPKLAQEEQSLAAAAVADRTVITISTLGLVLLVVLLIVLLT